MEIRTPKVIEKRPEIWGFSLAKVAIILAGTLGMLFLGPVNIKLALVFPVMAGVYFFIDSKFPAKGELLQFIAYNTGNKCIQCRSSIKNLLNKADNIKDKNKE